MPIDGQIKVTNVKNSLVEDLTNIAKNKGIPRARFIKENWQSLVDSYPPEMKRPKN